MAVLLLTKGKDERSLLIIPYPFILQDSQLENTINEIRNISLNYNAEFYLDLEDGIIECNCNSLRSCHLLFDDLFWLFSMTCIFIVGAYP